MKQLLFLLLFPCLCMAQYTGNAGQKITLGEQTTADGLVFRGAAADTVTATLKITKTNKQDTSTYLLLDTLNNVLLKYNIATTYWTRLNLLPSDTTSMLTNYYRSGRALGTPTSGVLTNATGLPISTGLVGLGAANRIPYASSSTALTTSSNLTYNNSTLVIGNENDNYDNLTLKNKATTNNTTRRIGMTANTFENDSLIGLLSVYADATSRAIIFGGGVSNLKNPTDIYFYTSTNVENPADRGDRLRMFINDIGNVGIGTASPTEKLHVVGNARITAVGTVSSSNSLLYVTSTGVLSTNSSDVNKKHNVRSLPYGLNTINKLNPVAFDWNETDETDIGFIAQDIESIIPESVITNWDSQLIFRQEKIVPVLVKAIQEQNALIKSLEQRILILENK